MDGRLLRFLSFRGRATRREFAAVLAAVIAADLCRVLLGAMWPALVSFPVSLAFETALIMVLVSAAVRRLHDFGQTGWVLALFPIPMVGVVLFAWCVVRPSAT